MEREVLKFLDFELGNPTTKTFLRLESTMMLCPPFSFESFLPLNSKNEDNENSD